MKCIEMKEFSYKTFGVHTHFGIGKISVLNEVLKSFNRILLIAGKSGDKLAEDISSRFKEKSFERLSDIAQHVPRENVYDAVKVATKHHSEVLLTIGGGSSTGLGKAIALETKLPIIAIPTTYAGSEQTDIWGITEGERKLTGRADHVVPKIVIYDPNLTVTMPKSLAVTSAINAMAHLVEAVYSTFGNPVTSHIAVLGMKTIFDALKELEASPTLTMKVNEKLLFGAYLGGKCLSEVPMALHHKAAHVLGGTFRMDHAKLHTALLPYVIAHQWPFLEEQQRQKFVDATGKENPAHGLKTLAEGLGAATNLKDLGFQHTDIERASDMVVSQSFPNPAPVNKEFVVSLLQNAYEGKLD